MTSEIFREFIIFLPLLFNLLIFTLDLSSSKQGLYLCDSLGSKFVILYLAYRSPWTDSLINAWMTVSHRHKREPQVIAITNCLCMKSCKIWYQRMTQAWSMCFLCNLLTKRNSIPWTFFQMKNACIWEIGVDIVFEEIPDSTVLLPLFMIKCMTL